jgi:hypothetical protein
VILLLSLACGQPADDSSASPAEISTHTLSAGEVGPAAWVGDQLYQIELCYPDGRCVADSRGVRVMGLLCWPSGTAEACELEAPPDAALVIRLARAG